MLIIEVAKLYGFEEESAVSHEDEFKPSGVFRCTKEELQAFADHYRKECAAEANKTIEELKRQLSEASGQIEFLDKQNNSLREQLAATELVLEQMRAVLKTCMAMGEIRFKTCVLSAQAHDEIVSVMQLQPSLSALMEDRAKVLEDAADNAPNDSVEQFLRIMASELRAKGADNGKAI